MVQDNAIDDVTEALRKIYSRNGAFTWSNENIHPGKDVCFRVAPATVKDVEVAIGPISVFTVHY
eukprot:10111496-Heterocapsa_arctica.AAC.1